MGKRKNYGKNHDFRGSAAGGARPFLLRRRRCRTAKPRPVGATRAPGRIFTRLPERLLAKRIRRELAEGRCVIIASCTDAQRAGVREIFEDILQTTSEKERLYFTALERNGARPLTAESRRWNRMPMDAMLFFVQACSNESRTWCFPWSKAKMARNIKEPKYQKALQDCCFQNITLWNSPYWAKCSQQNGSLILHRITSTVTVTVCDSMNLIHFVPHLFVACCAGPSLSGKGPVQWWNLRFSSFFVSPVSQQQTGRGR